ncbi:hypothetical protein B0H15DRAFT_841809 [Mycena belliarum]|uniref:Uncharacterized protein n=1 Tax=Mycena belliarum TaxID=1033014 RepID=A0AAD6U5N2_9AGAR|nr:hypothetical protein B0H15DRAFT_841809 [Mycena belliae]
MLQTYGRSLMAHLDASTFPSSWLQSMGETMPIYSDPLNTETMAVRREVSRPRLQTRFELVQGPFYRVPPAKSFKNSCGLPILSVWLSLDGWRAREFARLLVNTSKSCAQASSQRKYLHYSRDARIGVHPTSPVLRKAALYPARVDARDAELARARRPTPYLEAPREFDASTSPARALSMPST